MENAEKTNRLIATIGNGLLLIWWGISIAVGPITIGMSAVGTGFIMLGVTAVRIMLRVPVRESTTVLGIIALVWGALDAILRLQFWASFAALLIVVGAVMIISLLPRLRTA
jgi:hypothetical protein